MKERDEILVKVPLPNGTECTIEYPTIAKLIVARNERLPHSGTGPDPQIRNDWNARMLFMPLLPFLS
jgi:hypothetical protein